METEFAKIAAILAQPAWDVLVLVFFIVAGALYGVIAGKRRLLAIFFALYVSQLLLAHTAYLDAFIAEKGFLATFVFRALAYIAVFFALAVLFAKTVFRARNTDQRWARMVLLSLLETGLFVSAVVRLLPARELFTFSPLVDTIFAQDAAYFWWLFLPLLMFPFLARNGGAEKRRI